VEVVWQEAYRPPGRARDGKARSDAMKREPDSLTEQIRILSRLVALSVVEGKTQVDAIRVLSRTGMDRNEIARTVGTSAEVVSVRLAEAKRGTRRRRTTPVRRSKK
jgi:hypothetical protein